jgi:hypothetical protein
VTIYAGITSQLPRNYTGNTREIHRTNSGQTPDKNTKSRARIKIAVELGNRLRSHADAIEGALVHCLPKGFERIVEHRYDYDPHTDLFIMRLG